MNLVTWNLAASFNLNMTAGEAVVMIVIGLIAGTLAGAVVTQNKQGFGGFLNLIFGLLGSFVGAALFRALDLNLGLGSLTLDLNQLAAACVGALLVVFGATFLHKQRQKKGK